MEHASAPLAAPPTVPTWRLLLLRATYVLIAVGLALMVGPNLLAPPPGWPLMNSVVAALLTGIALLSLLGVRHPLRMIPVLLFELVWKTVWLAAIALPAWLAGTLDERTATTAAECLFGVVLIPLVLPWRHVIAAYLRGPAEPWVAAPAGGAPRRWPD